MDRKTENGKWKTGDGKRKFRVLLFISYVFLLTPFSLLLTSPALASEIIREIKVENQVPAKVPDILAVIRMKVGDEFNREKLENAILDLRKWGIFKNVEALVKHEDNGVMLTFQLEEGYIIQDVEIHGNYPILERKIHRVIFLTPGDIFDEEKIPEQIDRILSFYEKEGYDKTTVFIEQRKNEERRTIILKIIIHKGRGFRINNVAVKGNTVFGDNRITNKISRFFDYKPSRLKKDLESIENLYRDAGYLRAKAKITELRFDEKKRTVDFTVAIREGKKIDILFTGNEHQFDRRLKKVIGVYETGDVDEFELDHSKAQLIAHYRSLGYEDVQVSYEKKILASDHIEVAFHIQEGARRVIKSISFEDNEAFSDKKLRGLMKTKEESIGRRGVFLKEVFDQDLENLETFYQQNGYIDAKVKDWKREFNQWRNPSDTAALSTSGGPVEGGKPKLDFGAQQNREVLRSPRTRAPLIETQDKYRIEIDVNEGKLTQIERLSFEGLHLFTPDRLKKFLLVKEGSPYSPVRLEEDVRAILVFYSQRGHPYVEIKTDIEEVAPQKVHLKYTIDEGPEVRIGRIFYVGNIRTRESAIDAALRFKEGDLFNPQKILESQTTLRKLGIFDALTLETLGLKGKETDIFIVVRVEEKKSKTIDLGISYDTDTRFRAKLTYTRLNLLGFGKNMDFKLIGGQRLNRGEVAYHDPRFVGSDWQFLSNLFGQFERRPFFQDVQAGGSAAWLRDLSKRLSLLLKYQVTFTDFNEEKTNFALLRPGTKDNTTGKFQFNLNYDRRDNFGDPHSGFFAGGKVEFGSVFQGGSANFFKIGTRFGHWYSPFKRLTIANALRGDVILALTDKDNVPVQELIFMGGDDTVRGFKQDAVNPAGGKIGLIYNLELQLRLFKGFEAIGFLDTGSDTNSFGEISLHSIRHSAGLGIHYVTPVGPIRLDYGFILDRQPGENRGRLHFTFGYFF